MMKIWFGISSFLNYLYNHLIDLVWTKKIRFADGTEMTTVPNGNNLYDIKCLSQAIADKGFAFMCHTTTRALLKSDVPTLYNNILNKYNSADIEDTPTTNLYNTTSKNLYVKDGYYYFNSSNSRELRRSANSDLSASELCFEIPEEIYSRDWSFIITDIGFWVCGTKSGQEHNEKVVYIYDFDYNLIQTINLTEDDNEGFYIFKKFEDYVYLSVGRNFYRFRDTINTTKEYMPRYYDIEEQHYEITWNMNIIDDNIVCCCLWNGDTYFRHFMVINKNTLTKQQLRFHDSNGYWDWHTDVVSNIFKFEDNYYFTTNRSGFNICKLNIETGYISEEYRPKVNGVYMNYNESGSLCEVVGDKVIIQSNGHIFTTTDLINFTILYTITGGGYNKCANWYLTNNTMIFFFQKDLYKTMGLTDDCYLYIGFDKKEFTDTYNINGTTVNIKYFKFQDFKICISDNGGTNDTNIKTVYDYLGYSNYWLIDTTNETITIQRNKQGYVQMYVGDGFVDDLDDLPTISTRPLPQAEEIIDSSANVNLDVLPNTDYNLTNANLSSLALNSYQDNPLGTTIRFNSGSTPTSITDNTSINWVDGATPIPSANVKCLIFIWNNIGFYKEW